MLIPSARTAFHAEIESHVLDLGSKLVFCSAQSLLKATQQLVLLGFGKRDVSYDLELPVPRDNPFGFHPGERAASDAGG